MRVQLIFKAAMRLDECKMIRFEEHSGAFGVTDLGRVASHFYIQNGTIYAFENRMRHTMDYPELLALISGAHEFGNIRVREEELQDLDELKNRAHLEVLEAVENGEGKVNVLLQAYISQLPIKSFTLISDMSYINQSAGRISRALFEVCCLHTCSG